jgi:hypothetical protein
MLQQAMQLSVAQAGGAAAHDDDAADYNNELRMGILEAYSGLFQVWGGGWVGGSQWVGGAVGCATAYWRPAAACCG